MNTTAGRINPTSSYSGPIFDSDTHVHENDFEFFKEYLPKQYHEKWLPARKVGPDGKFGLYIGDRPVLNRSQCRGTDSTGW
jgi:hypothetical protein